jgi:integrase/recombinase XerD
MIYTFESRFAGRIEDFIAQKNALGFPYTDSSRLLRDFDRLILLPRTDCITGCARERI